MGVLIGILIAAGILLSVASSMFHVLFLFGVGKATDGITKQLRKKDEAFDQAYIATPISTKKLQRKLTLTFISRWMRLIIGGLMFASIAVPIVRLAREGPMDGYVFIPLLLQYMAIAAVGFIVLVSTYWAAHQTKKLAGVVARPVLEEFFGGDLSYEPGRRISDQLISETRFVSGYTSIDGSDLVHGHYRGIPVMFSDITLTSTEKYYDASEKKEKTRITTLFKGSWIVAEFDRELTPMPLNVVEERNRDAIQTESVAFNKIFSVYCADEHTAFYILTPHFMERLIEVNKKAKGKSYFQFNQNRLQIATNTGKDQLEAKFFSVPNVAEMQERFRRELKQMTDVIDEMLQHERLFGEVDTPAN